MHPRDLVGKIRRRLAAEQLADLVAVEKRMKSLAKELKAMVADSGSTVMDLPGVGPIVAARTLADVGDVTPVRRPQPVRLLNRHSANRSIFW